jgi:hypothetical protein
MLRPERVVYEVNGITLIEVFKQYADGTSELAGYYVYGGKGDSSILHQTQAAGSAEFSRRLELTHP